MNQNPFLDGLQPQSNVAAFPGGAGKPDRIRVRGAAHEAALRMLQPFLPPPGMLDPAFELADGTLIARAPEGVIDPFAQGDSLMPRHQTPIQREVLGQRAAASIPAQPWSQAHHQFKMRSLERELQRTHY